jgi:hypothetical protein
VEFFASLLICVALIAVLAVFSSRMERRQIQRKKEENEASRKDTYERHQNISNAAPDSISRNIYALGSAIYAQSKEQGRQDRARAAREIVTIVVIAITAFFALGSDWIFYQQYSVMSGQLSQARDENRPWIGIGLDLSPFQLNQVFRVTVTYTNVGHSPAFNVSPWVSCIPVARGQPAPADAGIIPSFSANLPKAIAIILPGQSENSFFNVTTAPLTQQAIDAVQHKDVVLWFVGRVDYTDAQGVSHFMRIKGIFDPSIDAVTWAGTGNQAT